MGTVIRPIGHEDRLSLVDHLDELRKRLLLSGAVLALAFGFCLWQNRELLHIINKPLQAQTRKQIDKGQGTVGQAALAQQGALRLARDMQAAVALLAAPGSGVSARGRAELAALLATLRSDAARIPRNPPPENPVTLGIGEPFTNTLTVALYFSLLIAAPLILYELYGFVLPGLTPRERHAVGPLLIAVPVLFAAGVAFGYFVVLPAAVRFFVNFNASQFNVLVQASQFYKFAATILGAMGLIFQVPIALLAATRAGIVTPRQLRRSRRYALLGCAVIAAILPGDAITMVLETVPLYVLYEASILVASFGGASRAQARGGAGAPAAGPAAPGGHAAEPSVQQIIDHVDSDLSG